MDWKTAGVIIEFPSRLINKAGNFKNYAELLRAGRFKWVAVKIHDGTGDSPEARLISGFANALRECGILVGGWGVLQTDPVADAYRANYELAKYKLSFYIADAEDPHKGDMVGGDQGRSDVFVARFRKLRPLMPAALTTYGAAGGEAPLGHVRDDNRGPMHFKCWYEAGFRFLPQAYPNQYGDVYELDRCIRHARNAGWPYSWVHLMIGSYGGWGFDDYKDRLITAINVESRRLSRGFSLFLGDYTNPDDYYKYGQLIKSRWLANS